MIRSKPASETLYLVMENLSTYGITRVADLTYLDDSTNLYVYSAIRPKARSLTSSMGKGLTVDEAKCSAIIESIETYYAEEVEPVQKNISFKELNIGKNEVLNPSELFNTVKFSEDQLLDWCCGKLLRKNTKIFIPHCFLSLDSTRPINLLVGQNSNGLASGNTLEEAILYSFWELNERQSLQGNNARICVYNIKLPIEISPLLDINFTQYQNRFKLPVIGCYIQNQDPLDNSSCYGGFACRGNFFDAITGALFEAVQSKVGIISGLRDDITEDFYKYYNMSELSSNLPEKELSQDEVNKKQSRTVTDEYNAVLKLLADCNMDLAYYCYTQNDITIVKSFLVNL